MWKIILPAAALCCLLTANVASAEMKIGIVDMRVIATDSEPGKKAKATMTSKFGPEKDRLEKRSKDLQKQAEALKNSGAGTSREALEEKRVKFIREKQDLDQKAREFGARIEQDEAKLRNEMLEVVFQAAKEFSQKKGINYLVDAGSGILYADESMDVTKEFLEEVNRVFKANPPSGGAKSAPKKK